jgi:hypothetical protein
MSACFHEAPPSFAAPVASPPPTAAAATGESAPPVAAVPRMRPPCIASSFQVVGFSRRPCLL